MFSQSEKNILVTAHRGYKYKYPENTLLAFEKALELGVDMIEMDINLTVDKHLVVIHDNTIDRTTNGFGRINEMTLEQLKGYDAGSWFDENFKGLKIPTFEEFLNLVCKTENLLLNVEIKEKTFETVDLTVNMLEKYNMLDRCVIACFDASMLRYTYETYHLKTQGFPSWYMTNFTDDTNACLYSVGIEMKDLTKEICDEFRQVGIDPWAYCPDDDESVYKIIESGASLVTCNNPEPALRILKAKGLHK